MVMKVGRFSADEMDFIQHHASSMTAEQIARELNRDSKSIRRFLKMKMGIGIGSDVDKAKHAEYDLRTRPFWLELKAQFSKEEIDMLVYHWGRIVSQFKDDVFPTEELQILDAIKLEVFMGRIAKEQQSIIENIKVFEIALNNEKDLPEGSRDRDKILNLERNVAMARTAQEATSREYRELLERKNRILKDLRATREQRIKKIEDSRQTFVGWLTRILEDRALRKTIGIRMEKMRLAAEKERARLQQPHKYIDNSIDIPLLTPELIKEG